MTARTLLPPLIILADTREQAIPPFPEGVVVERVTMSEGDYTSSYLQGIAALERSRAGELASKMTRGRERVDDEIRRLLPYRWKAIIVEGDIYDVYRGSSIHPHSVIGSIASWYARSDIPVLFIGNAAGAGRLIAGLLSRWEERLKAERSAAA